jgi:outer membrane protein
MQRIVIPAFLSLVALSGAAPAEAAMKVAVVDVQKVMESTAHWKQALEILEKERVSRQSGLEKKQAELRERKEKLDAQKAVAAAASLVGQEEALYQEAQELTMAFRQNQQELTMIEKRATEMMLARLDAVVRQLSIEGDYAFVFETGPEASPNVWYAKKKIDITKQVAAAYEKAYEGKPLEFGK